MLVIGMLVAAVILAVAGLAGALRALHRGWAPRPRTIAAAGLLAVALLALLPPLGSADPESYAAYGHIAATGHSPYVVDPATAYERYGDRVAAAAEPPWQHTTSVYGPVATAEQLLAAEIGEHSVRTTVAFLAWLQDAAFALTGLLLIGLSPAGIARRRAALLWLANPLLLLELVAGAHVDVLVALGLVAAVALTRRATLPAVAAGGVMLGLAVGVKLTAAFAVVGLLWWLRRRWRLAAALIAGLAVVLVPAYALAGPHALDQTRTAARFASAATPWRWVASGLDATLGQPTSRTVLGALAAALTLTMLWLLLRRSPAGSCAGAALAGYVAYLVAAPYVLPWYAGPAWALLALTGSTQRLRAPAYTWVLLAWTGALAAGYLTRDIDLGGAATIVTALRSGLGPAVVLAVLVGTVVTARRAAPAG